MSYASLHMDLTQIQNDFASKINQVSLLSELDLSEEDYRYLATKIKMLFKFSNDNTVVDDFKLAIVVYWVFSMVYWDKQQLGTLEMDTLFEGLPQYKKKYYLDVCLEAFDDYGIYQFPVSYSDSSIMARALIARHAGIPKEEQYEVYSVVSQYLDCNVVEQLVESIMMELPARTQTIFCCFDDSMKQQVILDLRNIILVCKQEEISVDRLYKNYPFFDNSFLDCMYRWCEETNHSSSKLS